MAVVLVTGAGGASGIGALRALREETDHETVGVDMDRDAAGLYLADVGRTVPPAADESWPAAVDSVVQDCDVDVVVPTVDEELRRLQSLRSSLSDDVPVVAPRQDVIDLCLDKYELCRHLSERGHRVPRTTLATERESIDASEFPLVVKPRRGRGSRGVERLDDARQLEEYLDTASYDPEELLLQEFLPGTEYTTSVVATDDDRLLSVVPKEAVEKDGSTVKGVTRDAPSIADSCRDLFETLQPGGPVNVQQRIGEDGEPYVLEINPRFSSTSCLTVAAGVDEFDLLIRDALGDSVSPVEEFVSDLYILRYSDHVFVSEEELGATDP